MQLFWLDEHYDLLLTRKDKLVTNSTHLTVVHICTANMTHAKLKFKYVQKLYNESQIYTTSECCKIIHKNSTLTFKTRQHIKNLLLITKDAVFVLVCITYFVNNKFQIHK